MTISLTTLSRKSNKQQERRFHSDSGASVIYRPDGNALPGALRPFRRTVVQSLLWSDFKTEERYSQKTKSFGPSSGKDFNTLIKEAILFRLEKMREFGYIIDERSETIEKKCLKDNANMEEILNISFKDFEVE